jgi:glycine oxidase
MQRFLIIGSGLIGRLTAWRLIQAGHAVTILSADNKAGTDSAGFIAASMIAPFTEAVTADRAIRDMGIQSQALWNKWLAELDTPVFYPKTGTLVVAHEGDKAELGRYQRRAEYILEPADYQQIDRQQLQNLSPELAEKFSSALYFAEESCLDNRQFYQQVGEFLTKHADWKTIEPIESLTTETLEALCQQTLGYSLDKFTSVIDCRGNGSKADINDLRGVRGEVQRVYAPELNLQQCVRLMHPRYPLYLAPRPDHQYVIGATVIESEDRSPVSVRSAMELLSALYSINKGFAEARVLEMQAHCRPALPDHLPTIRQQEWGYQLNGFYRHGYLLGPVMVDQLLTKLSEQTDSGVRYAS